MLHVEPITMVMFSKPISPAFISSVKTLSIRNFMTSVKADSQRSLPSIFTHRRAVIPFSAALTFWHVPRLAQVITFQSITYDIFLLQFFLTKHKGVIFGGEFKFVNCYCLLNVCYQLFSFYVFN